MSQNDFLRWCLFFCFVFFGQAKKMKAKQPISWIESNEMPDYGSLSIFNTISPLEFRLIRH